MRLAMHVRGVFLRQNGGRNRAQETTGAERDGRANTLLHFS
jgi:hypothetical protein